MGSGQHREALRLEIHDIRSLLVPVVFGHLLAVVALWVAVLPPAMAGIGSIAVLASVAWQWRCLARQAGEVLGCDGGDRWTWQGNGLEPQSVRLRASLVSPGLIVLALLTGDGTTRTRWLTPGMVGADAHRRARVRLREYPGGVPARAETGG